MSNEQIRFSNFCWYVAVVNNIEKGNDELLILLRSLKCKIRWIIDYFWVYLLICGDSILLQEADLLHIVIVVHREMVSENITLAIDTIIYGIFKPGYGIGSLDKRGSKELTKAQRGKWTPSLRSLSVTGAKLHLRLCRFHHPRSPIENLTESL